MSKVNDGGPALVGLEVSGGFVRLTSQLTLRDYFAAKALQSLIDGQITVSGNGCMSGNGNGYTCRSRLCQEAYEFADSMLVERDK